MCKRGGGGSCKNFNVRQFGAQSFIIVFHLKRRRDGRRGEKDEQKCLKVSNIDSVEIGPSSLLFIQGNKHLLEKLAALGRAWSF